MLPIVHGLEDEYWEQIDFVYLDHTDSLNADMMVRYDFSWRPLFILVEADGTEVQRWFGFVEEQQFRTAFDALLNQS